jgi:hypothetical protein
MRWSAAQMLAWIDRKKPLELKEWSSDMDGQILPAQLKLREAIVQRRVIDVRGRRGPPGSKQRMPDDLLSDPEFTLLVTPHGAITVHPPHKRHKYEEKYGIDLDKWWREIDFDRDEGEHAFPAPPTSCQGQPDRSHLRLVSGTGSDETEASAVRTAGVMPELAPAAGPPQVELVPSTPMTTAADRQLPAAGEPEPSQSPQPQQLTNKREPNSGDAQSQSQSPNSPAEVAKLSGKQWVSKTYARRPNALLAMGITGASKALAEESKTAPDCAKPLTARYSEKLLRDLGVFPKAHRGSPKQRPK